MAKWPTGSKHTWCATGQPISRLEQQLLYLPAGTPGRMLHTAGAGEGLEVGAVALLDQRAGAAPAADLAVAWREGRNRGVHLKPSVMGRPIANQRHSASPSTRPIPLPSGSVLVACMNPAEHLPQRASSVQR